GPVDVIVRAVNEAHEIEEVGLAMQHAEGARPRIPLFQTPRELRQIGRSLLKTVQRWTGRGAAGVKTGSPDGKARSPEPSVAPSAGDKAGQRSEPPKSD